MVISRRRSDDTFNGESSPCWKCEARAFWSIVWCETMRLRLWHQKMSKARRDLRWDVWHPMEFCSRLTSYFHCELFIRLQTNAFNWHKLFMHGHFFTSLYNFDIVILSCLHCSWFCCQHIWNNLDDFVKKLIDARSSQSWCTLKLLAMKSWSSWSCAVLGKSLPRSWLQSFVNVGLNPLSPYILDSYTYEEEKKCTQGRSRFKGPKEITMTSKTTLTKKILAFICYLPPVCHTKLRGQFFTNSQLC